MRWRANIQSFDFFQFHHKILDGHNINFVIVWNKLRKNIRNKTLRNKNLMSYCAMISLFSLSCAVQNCDHYIYLSKVISGKSKLCLVNRKCIVHVLGKSILWLVGTVVGKSILVGKPTLWLVNPKL